jgi:hypothetical protein
VKLLAPAPLSIALAYELLAPANDPEKVIGIVTVNSDPDPLAVTPCGLMEHWLFASNPGTPAGAPSQLSVSS